jgi:uncharacterized protein (TIGR02300 family)
LRYGKAPTKSQAGATFACDTQFRKAHRGMIKPEWGTKRTCPKCATRFYDLEKDDPVTCINCGTTWNPEPILKSKQPLPFEQAKPDTKEADRDLEGEDEDLEALGEEEEPSADDEVDLGGDDDLGVEAPNDEDEH